eukprot:gene31246-39241_t
MVALSTVCLARVPAESCCGILRSDEAGGKLSSVGCELTRERIRVMLGQPHAQRKREDVSLLSDFLIEHPFFKGFTPEQLLGVVPEMDVLEFPSSHCVYRQRDLIETYYIVLQGSVSAHRNLTVHEEQGSTPRSPETMEAAAAGEVLNCYSVAGQDLQEFGACTSVLQAGQ